MVAGSKKADASVGRLERRVKGLGASASSVQATLGTVFLGFAAAAGGREAISTIASFEEQILTLQAVTGESADQVQRLSDTARELGTTTRFTGSQAAAGFVELARAGQSVEQQLSSIKPVLDLAIIAQVDLAESSQFVISSLAQFGLQADQSGRIADVLAKAANSASTDVRQLALGLSFAGKVAAETGLDFETTNAALAALANAGQRGFRAGTLLRGALVQLSVPNAEVRNKLTPALEAIGLTLEDINPKAVGLQQALDNLSKVEFDAFDVFGSERGLGIAILRGEEGRNTIRELSDTLNQAGGAAAEFSSIIDSGLVGSFKSLQSAIEGTVLSLGVDSSDPATLVGGFKVVVDSLTVAFRIIAGVEGALEGASDASKFFAQAIKVVFIALSALIALKVTTFFISMLAPIFSLTTALIALVATAITPVLTALTVLGAAIAAFELGRFFFDEFRIVQESAAKAINFITKGWEDIKAATKVLGASIKAVFFDVFDKIREPLQDYLRDFGEGLKTIESVLGFNLGGKELIQLSRDLKNFGKDFDLENVISQISDAQNEAKNLADEVLRLSLEQIQVNFGDKQRKGGTLREFIEADINELRAFVESATPEVRDLFLSGLEGIEEGIADFFEVPEIIEDTGEAAAIAAPNLEALAVATEKVTDTTPKLTDEMKNARDEIDKILAAQEYELEVIGRLNDSRDRSREAIEFLILAERAYGEETEKIAEVVAEFEQNLKNLEETSEDLEILEEVAADVADTLASAFADAVTGAQDFDDVLKDVYASIVQIATRAFIQAPLEDFLQGFISPSAKGNVFSNGRVKAFAQGGIINAPTVFPLRGGTGLAGEAGPEAILPLQRDEQGNLGVSGSTSNVTINVTTPDVRGFELNARQIARRAQAAMRRRR